MPSVNGKPKHILLIQGHPDPDPRHFCHALAAAYETGAVQAGHDVERLNIASLQFPFVRSRADLEDGSMPESIRQAQASLLRADHVVLCFPIWNGGMPAIDRAFFEQTFRSSFIFPDAKPGEKLGFTSYFKQRKALAGKTARTIVTMAMPAFVYRWYFHPHLEKNSLKLAGLTVQESLVGGADSKDARTREQWLRQITTLGGAGR